MGDFKSKFDDWMVRISFADADAAELGMKLTDSQADRKSKLAFDKIMVVRSEAMDAQKSGVPGEFARDAGHKLRVMIIDDEPIVGKRLKPALSKHGFEVESFLNPTEALDALKKKNFDIVVTDLRMEELDGIQVLEYIMNNCKNTRVILITGYATVEVAREALVKGAFDFIAKPFKPNDLRAVINKAALSLGHTVE